jgi:hypothetical protein
LTQDIPLSSFSLQLGAALSRDGTSITFGGKDRGFVVFGPYVPIKIGLYTFVVDILFPISEIPCAFIDIYGEGIVFASQRISTHCSTIRIQTYVRIDCRLEVRLYSEWTSFEIKRVTYALGVATGAPGVPQVARVELRGALAQLINADRLYPDALQEWADPKIVANALFGDNHVQMLPINSLYDHEGLLRHAGIMPAVIQAFFVQNNAALIEGAVTGDLVDGFPKLTNAFQPGIVASGFLELISPYDGSLIRTQNSIPVPVRHSVLAIVYEFQGKNPIVVGTGTGWAGTVSFIWLVTQDIVIYENEGYTNWSHPEEVISEYLSLCVQHFDQMSVYRRSQHKPALASGFGNNMGHYFWNEVSGLERLIRLTGLNDVQTVYSPQAKWLAIKDIFACDTLPPVVELADWGKLFDEMLSRNEILVRSTATKIDDALANKIRRAAEARFAAEAPERWQSAEALSSKGQYVLYVNLRSHNKAWVEQDEGIIAIIRALRSVYDGDIIVYLDGWADCEESARSIASTPIDRVAYVMGLMGLHAGFPETLHWAFRCDFFVAVIGSGLVPLTWIANKPGICYGDTGHLHQMNYWQDVRHGSAPISWPAASQIWDHENLYYTNYSIEPAIMVKLFLNVYGTHSHPNGS